jgi:HlyB family type I secretion system ABC transporter
MSEARAVLERLPLLRALPPELRSLVAESFVPVSYAFGSTIVREGDDADAFYVLAAGRARAIKEGPQGEEVPLNVLRAGDGFGEVALVGGGRRTATVRASSEVEAFRLDAAVFQALLRQRPELRAFCELQTKHHSLRNFFRLYSSFAALPAEALQTLLAECEAVAVQPGDLVIRHGDEPGPMYVVEEGRLRVFRQENGHRDYVGYLRRGDFFGEMSVFKKVRRTASVEAVSECRLLRLRPETIDALLEQYPSFKAQLEERIAQYDYRQVARVPLDFSEEILPAEAAVQEKVGPRQVDRELSADAPGDQTGARLGPFASPEGYFVKRGRKIRRFPHVSQIDEMDCGAACLAMVCRYFGRQVSLARIRQLVFTASDGTSLKGLCRGAEALGLAARSVKASKGKLAEMPLPAVVHWEGNHWIVLYQADDKWVRVADPAVGLRRLSRAEFDEKWTGYAALFDYTREFEQAPVSKPSLRWLWPFFRPFTGLLLKCLGLAVVVSALEMTLPIFTQVIVDRVLVDRDLGLLNLTVVGMIAVLCFTMLAMIVQRYLLSFVAVRVDAATLDDLTRRLLSLPMSYFNRRRTGDIQRRLQGMRHIREFAVEHAVAGLTALTQLAAALALMLVYNPLLTGVFLLTAPLYAGLMVFSTKRLKPLFDELEASFGKYSSHQIDAIKGIETVKAMGAEGSLRELMLNEFHGLAQRQFRSDFIMLGYEGAIGVVSFLTLTLFLWVGAHQVMSGALTIGGLVAFNSLVALANQPILTVLAMWDGYQQNLVLLNRLNDIFEQEPEQGADHSHLKPVRTMEGHVRFHKLSFQYGGPESPKILDSISFEVPAGKMVAIVGRSGSGKTTLIKCLSGLLEPTEGTIYFDGVDMKTLNYRGLRRQIGFVLQENYLFNDSIARNIAFGEDEPDLDRVLWAARVASAHEFIERLPLGYETKVGESGIALSGGQRQRIAIARAVYHQPPILIFDEATSALDTESERAVQQNMAQLLAGRTSFVIAHRLSTIREADLILVMEKGRLAEHGNHDELMKRQGLYYYLSSQQLGFE